MNRSLKYGIDVFLQQSAVYKNKRFAFVTNNAATTSKGELSRVALLKNGINIVQLFSPEHGITTTGDDGAFQQNATDTVTGLPVISLYGNKLAPAAEDLENIDLVLFDIPDVGCRFYTYLWTMTHVMEACAANQKPFVVLDRPNPIGAELSKAEGPFLDEQTCSSFIGRWSIPIKHNCTLGELALYFAATKISALNIDVIKTQHYKRAQTAAADFFFIPTSPAIQQIETSLLYPGTGLLEGINVNEGRGTELPFQICGAPWMKNEKLKQSMEQLQLPGVAFTTCTYKPAAGMYANENCNGLQLHVTAAKKVAAVKIGIALVQIIIQLHPESVKERLYTTNANPAGIAHLDKLLGVQHAFTKLQQGHSFETNVATEWEQIMKPYLLYE